jgi:hypothetical protein
MGLLDVSDDDVKNHKLYGQAHEAKANIEKALEQFKANGATESRVYDVAKALKQQMKTIEKAMREFPDFAEFNTLRDYGVEVAKALVGKFPENSTLSNFNTVDVATNPEFRFG